MSISVSDDSEYCSDVSCDSLNSPILNKLEESETLLSAASFAVSDSCDNDAVEIQAMETDSPATWYDAADMLHSPNNDTDAKFVLSLSSPIPDAEFGGHEVLDVPDDLTRTFSRLALESKTGARSARSEEGCCRNSSKYMRMTRSFSCLRSVPRRRSKSATPASDTKHVSYLELYRRKKLGAAATARQRSATQKEDSIKYLRESCKEIAVGLEEAQLLGHECPSNTPASSGSDIQIVDDSQTNLDIDIPQSKDVTEQKFIQAACDFTRKGRTPLQLQSKKPTTKPANIRSRTFHIQVPQKLGSLGRDLEAVKDKYERLLKQQNYGKQASIRNRVKMSHSQKACSKTTEENKDVLAKTPHGVSSDGVCRNKNQFLAQQPSRNIDVKTEVRITSRRKDCNQANRASEIPSRCTDSALRSKISSVRLHKTMATIAPLVERHLKENEAVECIRRGFRGLKLKEES